jgi:ABC-type Mn2+/Zn2+ transport system permease subunit
LQCLVAPLDNMSRVVKRVPIVGRVLGTSLVVIPVSITGDLRDPKVQVMAAGAIGASLVNLMSATFKAPIELLDPSAGKAQRSP